MFKLIYLFSLLYLCWCYCDHDNLEYTLERIPEPEFPPGRMLAVVERQNIRIGAFYFLEGVPDGIATKIREQLIPGAISYFEAALKVNRLPTNLIVQSHVARMCGDVDPPGVLSGVGVPVDLVIFVTGKSDPESTITASARSCVLMNPTNRPILGVITYNYVDDWSDMSEVAYEGDLLTTIHELTHVLGFSPNLFDNFIDPNTAKTIPYPLTTKIVNSVETGVLNLEPLTTRLRNYFNCPTLEGAYLENQGGDGSKGSHFERRIFYNEYMTASEKEDRRITEFTLALLEGTGWYTPDYDMADPLFWGKGKGCGFLDQTCINMDTKESRFSEFCSDRTNRGCTYSGGTKGVCGTAEIKPETDLLPAFNYFGDNAGVLDGYSDNCPYYYGLSGSSCYNPLDAESKEIDAEFYGAGSMCFTGTLNKKAALSNPKMFCFKPICQELVPGQFLLLIEVGNITVPCTADGVASIPGYKGTLNCPDVYDFCTTKAVKYCKRGCMGRGICINGECYCHEGYEGESCSFRNGLFAPEDEFYIAPFLHILSIPIGFGIIATTIIIGVIINKINAVKQRKSRQDGYASVKPPIIHNHGKKKGTKDKAESKLNIEVQSQLQSNLPEGPHSEASTEQQNNIRGVDAISVIRGLRGSR